MRHSTFRTSALAALAALGAVQGALAQSPQELMVCSVTVSHTFASLKDPGFKFACTEVLSGTNANLSLHELATQGWQPGPLTAVRGNLNIDVLSFWSRQRGASPAPAR